MGMIRALAALAAALVSVAACSAPAPTLTPAAQDLASSDAAPAHLAYMAVGVDADVTPTGLNPDGTVHVPDLDKPAEVDYLNWGAQVGAGRPLVFISHVNGRTTSGQEAPGGFASLNHAAVGDTLTVTGRSGAQVDYRVTTVRTVAKTDFPSSVYAPTPTPEVVLITCGGQLVDHNYLSNVIVTATAD